MNIYREWQHRRQRRQHQKYAQTMGVFWKECPSCGEFFGGHEWEQQGVEMRVMVTDYGQERTYEGLCPACCLEGRGWPMDAALDDVTLSHEPKILDIGVDSSELLG